MSTRHDSTPFRASRGRGQWDADDDYGLDDLDDINDLDSFDEELEPDYDRRPRRPARGPAKGGRRKERKSRVAVVDDDIEFDEEDEVDPEISDLLERKERERRKATISEPFKCRNCRAFIGMPPSGGSQRNHCPMCLYSLHVDLKTPGDRASDCRSLMEPIGTFYRPNLEQVVVHRCLGCGFVRYNRIAADDNPVLLSRLPLVDPPKQVDWDDN